MQYAHRKGARKRRTSKFKEGAMGNHCVDITCAECGYEMCVRCSSDGFVNMDVVKTKWWYAKYVEDEKEGNVNEYKRCPHCGRRAMK
jgi:predicted RNA-binding Zn-ribbon protein involved in translation (DUF1610 family)